MSSTWIFYDTFAKTQSKPLTQEEAQTAIFKMRPVDIERFYIWTTGWSNWQALKSYMESDQKNFVSTFIVSKRGEETIKAVFREVVENTHTSFTVKKEDSVSFSNIRLNEDTVRHVVNEMQSKQKEKIAHFDGEEITWSNIQKPEMDFSRIRNAPMENRSTRHELKIEVLLISPKVGKTFRSRSKNISLTGTMLEDNIPFDYYDTVFDVVVINNYTKDPQKSRVKLAGKTVAAEGLSARIQYVNVTEVQKKSLENLLQDYINLQKTKKAG